MGFCLVLICTGTSILKCDDLLGSVMSYSLLFLVECGLGKPLHRFQ